MKEKIKKWIPDVRKTVLVVLGFLIGRVWIGGINPFAVAYFAALWREGINSRLAALLIIFGMFTGNDGIGILKYAILFLIVLAVDSLQKKSGQARMPSLLPAIAAGAVNFLLGAALSFLSLNTWEMLGVSVLESVAVFSLAHVYGWGIRFFLYGEWRRMLGNEELISLLLIFTSALLGVPDDADRIFSIVGTIGYTVLIFMGFRYGAAAGAITGAAVGILAAVRGDDPVMIGVCCVLGITVGIFRKTGRVGSVLSFFLMGYGAVFLLQEEMTGVTELRAMLSSVVLFFALPGDINRIVETDEEEQKENLFAKEDVRALANYRIRDFADAFKRLSRSFMEGGEREVEIAKEEMEEIYEELTEKICKGCANCTFCWERYPEETRENICALIQQAGRNESAATQVSEGFGRRCMRLAVYEDYVTDRMAVARMNLGWRNRMAENREIIGIQMQEVSDALRSFSIEIGEAIEVSSAERRVIAGELKKEGVRLHQLTVKRRRGRLEVGFTGFCKPHRCLTKTDLAAALSRASGVPMCPGRECRNVLSTEEVLMFFREDTRYKTLTGVARVAKSGENVSGDNYSFLELSGGELLMLLSDGMGSGENAYRDSGSFLEVMEYMLEAGFEKKSALRLLNTLFVMNFEGQTFTTMDMVSLDLHTGTCEIVKNGAAATYIRSGHGVDTIRSDALPVGIDPEASCDVAVKQLKEGDMVIMVSDGVIDGFERKNEKIEEWIEKMESQNPQDVANQILVQALAGSARDAVDDMSVLAAGLWVKNPAYRR